MAHDHEALLKRLREQGNWYVDNAYNLPLLAATAIEQQAAEIERLVAAGDGDVGPIHYQGEQIEQQAARIAELEAALREVFEEWAGSEGFIPETAPEGYLLQLTQKMALIASQTLGDKQ